MIFIPDSKVVKLTKAENSPTFAQLTAATLHAYVLYSSRSVTVIEVSVVFVLSVGSPNCSALMMRSYRMMSLRDRGGIQDRVAVVAVTVSTVTFTGAFSVSTHKQT